MYEFDPGNLISLRSSSDGNDATASVPDELLAPETDARFVLDRANVIYGWLSRNGSGALDSTE